MSSNSQYSINNDSDAPLLGTQNQGDTKTNEKKAKKKITETTVFQTIISVVITIIILIGMVGLVIGASLRENMVSYNVYDIVGVDNIKNHLAKLNTIAAEHRGNRDILDGGFNASVDYVVSQLSRYKSVFNIEVQNFTSNIIELEETPVLNVIYPGQLSFIHGTDFTFHPSYEGEVEGEVAYAWNGCNSDLYTPSTIAIVTDDDDNCTVDEKIEYASQ